MKYLHRFARHFYGATVGAVVMFCLMWSLLVEHGVVVVVPVPFAVLIRDCPDPQPIEQVRALVSPSTLTTEPLERP